MIGSGPAGLAAAQQLTRAGHLVTVYEREDRPGGLLRYGIPEFKMEKRHLDRRLAQMEAEGTTFVCGTAISAEGGPARMVASELVAGHDAVVIATGSTVPAGPRDPGTGAGGHPPGHGDPASRQRGGRRLRPVAACPINAAGKRVVIIGGGDTGADCLGTVHRQGAASVHQFEILPATSRRARPLHPMADVATHVPDLIGPRGGRGPGVLGEHRRVPRRRERCGARPSGSEVQMAVVDGRPGFVPVNGTEFELPCEMVLLALGFSGPEPELATALGASMTPRGIIGRSPSYETDVPGVFVCGDAGRGQSLIVWAIAEGRSAAMHVDRYLSGETQLPAPLPFA